ncbi:bifunctional metallophosphatase/5'-nucleotidase [Pseudorhodoferax sp.]|uniref:bifunctional metallophosphatase/5'-nucleotidase n=1 Tax=Pseudorhodoferax sp. TaxID=1993553 RepID=UPI0039E6BBBC
MSRLFRSRGPAAPPVRRALLALAAVLLAGCAGAPPAPAPDSAPPPAATATTLRVIAFNDFHGHLEPAGLGLALPDPRRPGTALRVAAGGAAPLAGLVAALRQDAPHSVVVSTGDLVGAAPLVSALFRHESTVEAMNQLGLDVATAGNHEFDAGAAELQRLVAGGCAASRPGEPSQSCARGGRYAGARFAMVLANVRDAAGHPLFAPAWVQRYGGVAVGFIGAVTRTTPGIVVPSGVAGLRFEDEAEAINRSADALQAQGVKAIVALVHEGGALARPADGAPADWNDPRCPGLRGRIVDIVQRLSPQVDLVLSAHTHQGYNCLVDGRPVLQAYAQGRGVSVADLVLDPATGDVDRARTRTRNLPVLNALSEPDARQALLAAEPAPWGPALRHVRPDEAVAGIVAGYAAAAAPRAQRPVGRIAAGFDRQGRTDSAAGRLVADAQLAATRAPEHGGAQLALMNPGGVRTDLACHGTPPCTVTYGDAFAMQPFGNSLVVMTLTGAELKTLLEGQQPPGRAAPSFLQPSAGFGYRWQAGAPPGQRVRDMRLHGRPIGPQDTLRIAVNSFMAEGGDGLWMLTQGRERIGGAQDLDALLAYLQVSTPEPTQMRIVWED